MEEKIQHTCTIENCTATRCLKEIITAIDKHNSIIISRDNATTFNLAAYAPTRTVSLTRSTTYNNDEEPGILKQMFKLFW